MKTLQKKFKMSKGEINPLLAERQDTGILDSSASYIKNYVVSPYGGFRTRGGTVYIDRLADKDTLTRIIPLEFTDAEKYILVCKNESIDIYQSGVFLSTLTATDLLEDYFDRLKFTQTSDRLILTHPELRPKQIRKGTGAANFIPTFGIGETSKDGFVITGLGGTTAGGSENLDTQVYKAFDANDSTNVSDTLGIDGGVHITTIECSFDTTRTVEQVELLFDTVSTVKVEKEVGGVYTQMDQVNYVDNGTLNGLTKYTLDVSSESWDGMRITLFGDRTTGSNFYAPKLYSCLAASATAASLVYEDITLENIPLYAFDGETSTSQTVGITPSDVEGNITITADSAVFLPEHEGQYIDLTVGTRVKITEYISNTKVSGYTIIPFVDTDKVTSWFLVTGYIDVWSSEKGWPNSCLFYQDRLWFGGSKSRPSSIWASRVDKINDFGNLGSYDNDGIDITISGTRVGEIVNLSGNRGLQTFTKKAEYVSPEGTLTPNSITVIETTSKGSSEKVNPITINGITMFIDKNSNSLLDFVYTEEQGAYTTREGAILNSHLIVSPVAMSVDNNSNIGEGNYLNIVMGSGEMVTTCTLLEQKINAFVRFITEGSITDVANLGSDTYITINRENGVYLERLGNNKVDAEKILASSSTITGLTDFANEDVRIYDDSENYGVFAVNGSGEVTFPEGDVGLVKIGYDIDCQIISNKMQVNGQTNNIYTKIGQTTIVTSNTDVVKFNKTTKNTKDDMVRIMHGSGFKRDNKFTISSTFDYLEILSIVLNLNYGKG